MYSIFNQCNFYVDFFVSSATVKVVYETDEPKNEKKSQSGTITSTGTALRRKASAPNDVTRISTNHFLVDITKDAQNKSKTAIKPIKSSNNILSLGDAMVRDDKENEVKTAKGTVPDGEKESLKTALVGVIIDKLKEGDIGGAKIKDFVAARDSEYPVKETDGSKRQLTDTFIKFLEDLSKKLNLDVVTVGEQLISRSSERPDEMEVEMNAGYARDIIPSVPLEFKPIIKFISKIVNTEVKSARLLNDGKGRAE